MNEVSTYGLAPLGTIDIDLGRELLSTPKSTSLLDVYCQQEFSSQAFGGELSHSAKPQKTIAQKPK